MVCQGFADGEGELLRQIRAAVGDDIPLVISLDLYANISPEMVDYTVAISIFWTYPNLDMAATGARCGIQMCYFFKQCAVWKSLSATSLSDSFACATHRYDALQRNL